MQRICIIGAGPSGITAAKNLLDEGLDITIYDYGREVGGNWVFSEDISHSSVFETTHIISSKTLSEYADFPYPVDYPDYPSHWQLASYFQSYAKHFGLYDYIQFETEVTHAALDTQGKWIVKTKSKDIEKTELFDYLVVANGHHWLPRIPNYEGSFTGKFIHSHAVKRFSDYREERVLVVGGGNSACDVAVETSRFSKKTDLSWRKGYWIVPKFLYGEPTDVVSSRIHFLPKWLWQKLSQFSVWVKFGSWGHYGLQKPAHPIGYTHPTVNDELMYFIRHGKIHPRKDIKKLEGKTVYFVDGTSAEYDTIIACTGYIIAHPFFDKSFIDYSEGEVPLYLRMLHPQIKNLYFIGLFQPLGCIWPAAELQSKIMAREIVGKWKRPENMQVAIRKELDNPDYVQDKTPRHTITVDYQKFKKRLLRELPNNYTSLSSVAKQQESVKVNT
jgi:hypothetical protein